MADCLCDNLVIDSCPPYAAQKSFKEFLERECNTCTGSVAVGTANASLKSTAGIDDCCEEIIINRESQVVYSIDGGTTWVETGVRRIAHRVNFGSIVFAANSAQVPNITTSTVDASEITVNYTSNRFTITEAGTYLCNFTFVISPNAAFAATPISLDVVINGAFPSPRIQSTPTFATTVADNLFYQIQTTIRINANDGISFRFLSGTAFTSSTTSVYIDMFKVSN